MKSGHCVHCGIEHRPVSQKHGLRGVVVIPLIGHCEREHVVLSLPTGREDMSEHHEARAFFFTLRAACRISIKPSRTVRFFPSSGTTIAGGHDPPTMSGSVGIASHRN